MVETQRAQGQRFPPENGMLARASGAIRIAMMALNSRKQPEIASRLPREMRISQKNLRERYICSGSSIP